MFPNLNNVLSISKDLKILYVEDSKDAREQTSKLLNNFFREIDIAVDGEDGLKKYQQDCNSYDLVITDINMPNLNGLEMSKKILKINAEQLIIVITAFNEDEHIKQFEEINITNYIHKPVDFKLLINALDNSTKIYQERKALI